MSTLDRVLDSFFSVTSLVLHTAGFIAWFALGGGVNLLTNIVSLEAIYLSLAIGIAQKGHHERTRKHFSETKDVPR